MPQPTVLLCENDPLLAWLLFEVLRDEGMDAISCASIDEIHAALERFPHAVLVSDLRSTNPRPELTAEEQAGILELAARAKLILTTTRQWASRAAELALGDRVTVIAKPFDLGVFINAVRQACSPAM